MKNSKRYIDLSQAEIDERAKLTPKEEVAVQAFLAAAKALPRTLHIHLDDFNYDLTVSKRLTAGSSQVVAELHKKSLCF